jgi:hypothetical protein
VTQETNQLKNYQNEIHSLGTFAIIPNKDHRKFGTSTAISGKKLKILKKRL